FAQTRVSDLKGLTVVNQRKWPFMYERLVKEMWGVQESIGMVPGRDPDLRAPTPRAASIREVSVRLDTQTAGNKRRSGILPKLSCAIYQQQPMGKALLHRAKMLEVTPQEGEPATVLAAALPRNVVVEGTFQILVSAAISAAPPQKNVIDLWWNTSFLTVEDGAHVFTLSELDVSPLKLAGRLHQGNAKLVVHHTHPHAESPRRRVPRKSRAAASKAPVDQAPSAGEGTPETESGPPPPVVKETTDLRLCAPDRSLPEGASTVMGGSMCGEGQGQGGDTCEGEDGSGGGGGGGGEGEGGGGGGGGSETVVSGTSTAGGDSAGGGITRGNPGVTAAVNDAAAVVADMEGLPFGSSKRIPTSDANDRDALVASSASSPSLPGPSPAGMISPVWTFEGRTPSNNVETSGTAIDDEGWTRKKTWASNQGIPSAGAPSPTRVASLQVLAPEDGVRGKRRALQAKGSFSKSTDSVGLSAGSTSAPTGTSASMRGMTGGAPASRRFPAHPGETDSESDDQLAVRASAFEGGNVGPQRPMNGPSPVQAEQWAMEMEMAFAQERRRWEEHQRCLETELDWALHARARAEARSEEDSARAEVLESRLAAWRDEYSMIEGDVKQAVRLLEMSLSGLMSAETALETWRGQVPAKAYEDIMRCLTKGDAAPSHTISEKE
ncbi:unnamed protein product, partial [Hapterophycus canaliculatus]